MPRLPEKPKTESDEESEDEEAGAQPVFGGASLLDDLGLGLATDPAADDSTLLADLGL